MLVDYKKFREVQKKIGYDYITKGIPFGGVRIVSEDEKGIEHSLVLTHKEFVKNFSKGRYQYLFTTDGSPEFRLNNIKPWQEYDQYDEMKKREAEKEDEFNFFKE